MNTSETAPVDEPSDTGRLRARGAVLLAIVILGGAALRSYQATESLWVDELHTSWVVAGDSGDVAPRARVGNQSPLYFYLVWSVVQFCGQTPLSLRLISLVSGTVLIGAAAWLVRSWTNSTASALLAALLVALHRDCIFFAQEARPYALVQLVACCQAAAFVAVLQKPSRALRLLHVAGSATLFYLHYTTVLLLLAEAVCLVVLRCSGTGRVRYRLSQASWDALWIAVALVPSVAHLLAIAQYRDNWSRIAQAWPVPYAFQAMWVTYGLLPAGALVLACRRAGHRRTVAAMLVPLCWGFCWFALPILVAWLTTWTGTAALLMVRYLVASVVGGIVLAATCHAVAGGRVLRSVLAVVLVAATIYTGGLIDQFTRDGRLIGDRNEAWARATAWLDGRLRDAELPVFLCGGLLEDRGLTGTPRSELVEYCAFPLRGIYRLEASRLEPLATTADLQFTASQRQLVRRHGGFWLLVRAGRSMTTRIVDSLSGDLRARGYRVGIDERREFGTLSVMRFSVPDG